MTDQKSDENTTEDEASELLGLNDAAIAAAEPEAEATPEPTPEPVNVDVTTSDVPSGQLDVHFHEDKPKAEAAPDAPRKNPIPEAREVEREDGTKCLPGDYDYPYDTVIAELNSEVAMVETHVKALQRASTLLRTAQAKYRRRPTLAEMNRNQQKITANLQRESNERKQRVQEVLVAAGLLDK